jgi:hypothetical protein
MSNNEENDPNDSTSLSVILEYLDDRGFKYTTNAETNHIELSVWGDNAVYRSHIRVTHEQTLFQAYFYYPIVVKENHRTTANELLARANRGLAIGSFEFDFSDGEVRFRVSQAIGAFPLEKLVVGRILRSSLNIADRYFPALAQHLYAGVTPEDAVYTAELDLHADNIQDGTSKLPESTEEIPQGENPQE